VAPGQGMAGERRSYPRGHALADGRGRGCVGTGRGKNSNCFFLHPRRGGDGNQGRRWGPPRGGPPLGIDLPGHPLMVRRGTVGPTDGFNRGAPRCARPQGRWGNPLSPCARAKAGRGHRRNKEVTPTWGGWRWCFGAWGVHCGTGAVVPRSPMGGTTQPVVRPVRARRQGVGPDGHAKARGGTHARPGRKTKGQ